MDTEFLSTQVRQNSSHFIPKLKQSSTYAAADKVDLPPAVDPDVKPAAVGHQETCGSNQEAELASPCVTELELAARQQPQDVARRDVYRGGSRCGPSTHAWCNLKPGSPGTMMSP